MGNPTCATHACALRVSFAVTTSVRPPRPCTASTAFRAPGRAVLVTGTVRLSMSPGGGTHDASEGETAGVPIEVIAREIQPLEGMREQAAREVVISPSNFDTFDEAGIKEILSRYPGSMPVSLEMRRPGQFAALQKIDQRLWVRPTPDFTADLEKLLGPKSVRYSYSPSP